MVQVKKFSSIPVPMKEMAEFYNINEDETKGNMPYVWNIFVATADGIASLKEGSHQDRGIGLGGAGIALRQFRDKNTDALGAYADWDVLQYGWAVADAVLAGSGILKAEINNTWMPEQRFLDYRRSLDRGEPLRVLITGTGFDAKELTYSVFRSEGFKTLVTTSEIGKERMEHEIKSMPEQNRPKAQIESFGRERVDLSEMLKYLRREHNVVYADFEGGPDIAGQMFKARLIKEFRLTISPAIAGYISSNGEQRPGPVKASFGADELQVMKLDAIATYSSHIFTRYKVPIQK